ncbi:MAG TPA: glycosyltransferase family 39 protein [Trichocoleus sp.]
MLEWLLRYRIAGFLLLWAGLLLGLHSSQQSYLAHDEGYYAQQARWILENQDWITVGWWGKPVYDRTIGLQWLMTLSYALFGFSEWAARLPSTVAGLMAVLLTWRLGQQLSEKRVGWWGAAILAVLPVWMQASQLGMQDVVLTAVELVGLWALLAAEGAPSRHGRAAYLSRDWGRFGWGVVAGATVGLGFFIKTFMVVLPVLALMPYLLLEHRRHRHLANPGLYLGLGLGFLPVTLWLGLSMARYGSSPLEELFGKVLALSRSDGLFESSATPLFYFWNIPVNSFPWALFAIAGSILIWRTPGLSRKWLWLGYPLLLFLLLLAFKTRTWYYALQLYPFIALQAAFALNTLSARYLSERPYQRRLPLLLSWVVAAFGSLLLVAGLAVLLPLPGVPLELRPYGWVGLGGGLGWLVPLWVSQRDRHRARLMGQGWLWQMGWLLGPWLAIAAAFLTGLWGNYAPDLKTALQQPPIAPVLEQHTVHFVQPDANAEAVLLTLYTPSLGSNLPSLEALAPGEYAWIENSANQPLPPQYSVIETVRGWQLVTLQNRESVVGAKRQPAA